jgi:hypothetical protein
LALRLIGDFGYTLPEGWELIKRYDRKHYYDELLTEYSDCYSPVPEHGERPNDGVKKLFGVQRFYENLYVPIAVDKKSGHVLFITDIPETPIVSIALDWSGEKASSAAQMNSKFYYSLSELESTKTC